MRHFPEVRALCHRARRPAIQILIALGMIAPGGVFMLRAEAEGWEARELGAAGAAGAADVEAVGAVEQQARDVVAQAWRERALDREREKVSAEFAQRFRIPLDLAQKIHVAAVEADVDPKIAFGLVRAESRFKATAVSPVGALGLTQLMPSTARWLVPGTTRKQMLDPRTNLRIGFSYLRQLLDDYEGNTRLALTAYNRGPGTVNSLLRRGRNPDNGYADLVLTGKSERHSKLMRAKFGRRRGRA